ncbi:MAG TPA: hypothetical protein VK724_01025 [Bryobacteraceae bacterium]|jgi:hypothetical protein|nr:hypothetical protein [Bryobacteraceae bacterium]
MLFTIILEFEGTNSVSQFSAAGPSAAYQKWLKGLENPNKYGLTPQQGRAVIKALAANRALHRQVNEALGRNYRELVPLQGLTKVWCVTASAGRKPRKSVLLNIIATVGERRE